MQSFPFFCSLFLGLSLLACQPTNKSSEDKSPDSDPANSTATPPAPLSEQQIRYAWVDKLNLRAAPQTSAAVRTQVDTDTPLRFTGRKSDNAELIVLRGVAYEEPWLEVAIPSDTTGWVFGGAVRRAEEQKGNAPITAIRFNFPYFGEFDLTNWEQLSSEDFAAGDAFGTEANYRQGNRYLDIRRSQTSEYGYQYVYTLQEGSARQLVKRRTLYFDATDGHLLTEKVDDFRSEPPLQHRRSQRIGKHFQRLNARPEMARGEWTKAVLFQDANGYYRPEEVSVQSFAAGDCRPVTNSDNGCSCDFSFRTDQEDGTVFYSDLGSRACVRIENKLTDLSEADYRYAPTVKAKVSKAPWVTLTQTGDLKILGDYIEGDWREALADALMVVDELPRQIQVENESTGMAIREVRDAVADILAKAAQDRAAGLHQPFKWLYEGGGYRVWIKVKNVTSHGGEADTYEGFLEVERSPGLSIFRRAVSGTCGC